MVEALTEQATADDRRRGDDIDVADLVHGDGEGAAREWEWEGVWSRDAVVEACSGEDEEAVQAVARRAGASGCRGGGGERGIYKFLESTNAGSCDPGDEPHPRTNGRNVGKSRACRWATHVASIGLLPRVASLLPAVVLRHWVQAWQELRLGSAPPPAARPSVVDRRARHVPSICNTGESRVHTTGRVRGLFHGCRQRMQPHSRISLHTVHCLFLAQDQMQNTTLPPPPALISARRPSEQCPTPCPLRVSFGQGGCQHR